MKFWSSPTVDFDWWGKLLLYWQIRQHGLIGNQFIKIGSQLIKYKLLIKTAAGMEQSWGTQGQMEASARNDYRMGIKILCVVCDAPILFCIQLYFSFSFSRSEAISRFALIVREFLATQNLNWITISWVIKILVACLLLWTMDFWESEYKISGKIKSARHLILHIPWQMRINRCLWLFLRLSW